MRTTARNSRFESGKKLEQKVTKRLIRGYYSKRRQAGGGSQKQIKRKYKGVGIVPKEMSLLQRQ
jgi:hypothetical protein